MSSLSVSASGAAADAIGDGTCRPSSTTPSPAGSSPRTPRCGARTPSPSRAIRLSLGGSPPLVPPPRRRDRRAARLASSEQGLDHVVLCGMGGSSLAPEVICATAGKPLVVLDSSDPDYVRRALDDDLDHTVVVVSSKSGSTVETDSQRRAYEQAFTDAGIDPASRIVVVTDPGSPLDEESRAKGYRVVNADPDVGGRYSALTAFGLVPSGLAGVDVEALLDEAESVADVLAGRRRRQPRPAPRRRHGRHRPAARQARPRRRRLGHRRLRRLGRAAHRRVHRQERHGRAARRRRGRRATRR